MTKQFIQKKRKKIKKIPKQNFSLDGPKCLEKLYFFFFFKKKSKITVNMKSLPWKARLSCKQLQKSLPHKTEAIS